MMSVRADEVEARWLASEHPSTPLGTNGDG
jgi:hypothetical protein